MSRLTELRAEIGKWKVIRTNSGGGRNPELNKRAVRQIKRYTKTLLKEFKP